MSHPTVSVLMAVYSGTPAEQLEAALGSVREQSRRADQIVVVVDGPVTAGHERVLADFDEVVTRVDLPDNLGLGRALAAGMARCTGDWVARADADDVNLPHRLETQLALLERTGAEVCSSSMRAVAGPSMRTIGIRRTPVAHQQFARRMRMSNPVNHPTVVFRREAALRAGGYRHLPLLEDYDLWARMLRDGAQFVGIDAPLVVSRVDGMLERRVDPRLSASERALRRNLRAYGLIGRAGSLRNAFVRGMYRTLPRGLRALVHRRVLGRPATRSDG